MKISKSAIFTLAHKLYAAQIFSTFSQALKHAWQTAKNDAIETIEFVKKSGEVTKRVVSKNILKYYTPKGTQRSYPNGLVRFVDVFKVLSGEARCIISTYQDNIISRA